MARHFAVQDETIIATIREGHRRIFSEDREMLEHQQRNLLRHAGRRLLKLNIDAGGVRPRASAHYAR
jgi:vanillate O-demethylase monooxygenase subunit